MFLTKINAAKSITDDFWYQPLGMPTASGVSVSPDRAMALSAVYACVKVLSESVAQLPLQIFERKGDANEIVRNHPLHRLLYRRPNNWQTSFEWREMLVGHVVLRGNSYNRIVVGNTGQIEQLIPIHPDHVRVEVNDNGNIIYFVKGADKKESRYTRDEIFHIRGLSSDGITGLSPIEVEREAIGMSLAAQDYGARFYQNDTRPPGWIEYPGQFKDKEARRKFGESWKAQQGGSSRHSTAILEYGMKYHEIGVSNDDAQFLETRKFQVEDIARIFRVPPHKIGHLERSTNNNIEHQGIEFVTDTLVPWLTRIEQAISRDLILNEDRFFAEFNVNALLRGDTKSRFEAYAIGIQNSFLAPNEARKKENLNPIDGLDKPMQQLNMAQTGDRESALTRNAAQVVTRKECAIISKSLGKEDSAHLIMEFLSGHSMYVSSMMSIDKATSDGYVSCITDELMNNDIKTLMETWEQDKTEDLITLCNT